MSGAPGNFQAIVSKTPPDKGSFPIDRENLCKEPMISLLKCLRDNQFKNEKCRDHTKNYLDCRMKHGLMAKEDWKYLGFGEHLEEQMESKRKKD